MMTETRPPKVSFVSLGCPKALVDSERIITRLRAEGYELARKHEGSDLAIVNTCGFLDSAKAESLSAIGEALAQNGKVIVTGCMGAEPETITERYPGVLAVTGPHWQTPPYFAGAGRQALETSRAQGLAGVVAKRLAAPYRPGERNPDWLAVSGAGDITEVVVLGWRPGRADGTGRRGGYSRFGCRIGTVVRGGYLGIATPWFGHRFWAVVRGVTTALPHRRSGAGSGPW